MTEARLPRPAALAALAVVVALAVPAVPGHAQSLRSRVDRRLDAAPFNRQLWGVALVDENGRLRYGRNQERLFIPASNTKLVVTAVAASLLPGDWTVRTSLYGGAVVDGILQGDLVLYGRGDPTFSNRCYAIDTTAAGACDRDLLARFRSMARTLKQAGIMAVSGDLVGDGSYFEPTTVHPGWESYDLNWWYAAPVSGLAFNDNSVDITWGPGPQVGAPAVISLTPLPDGVTLENRTRTVAAGSDDDIDFFRDPGTLHIRAEGTVAADSRGNTEYFAMPDPALYAAQMLRAVLGEEGIAVMGATRSTTDSLEYQYLRARPPLAEVESRPLRDWIFPILNTSQNTFAEILLKQVGRVFGTAGSWREGLRIERRFLIDSIGIDSTQFSLSDGSGLSSTNLVSPLAFTMILRYIRSHRGWDTFAPGLPQAGLPGSLRLRFRDTPLAGRVRAKTGSISRVNTISGFIDRPDGRFLTFSVQANHHALRGRDVIARIDSVVVELGRR
ncbi:MAG: D-alanyl-D-alanine carboxypeptidase/D-alanyl-D-alanine-endopeptidase [Gemmatimonadales bacterium]